MRSSILSCLVPVVLCAATSPSPANVTISNAATADMTCSGGICSPTAVDAILNVQDLEAMLASGNATVTTTGTGVQAVNIRVNAPLIWSAATTLALNAFHSIEVNRRVTIAGIGGVSLVTNDGGSGGDFVCNDTGRLEFSNLSSALIVNGTPYVLVNSVASLASAIAANPSGAFALASNYNAKKDGTFTSAPIATVFSGSFNGLGNTISNLSINDQTKDSYVGLFAETTGGSIANIRLLNEDVHAEAQSVGGLVGLNGDMYGMKGSLITHSFTTGAVSGTDKNNVTVGGLVGENGGMVQGSGSAATVFGGQYAGGLIGAEDGTIIDSSATGDVSGGLFCCTSYVGGLVGWDFGGDIRRSWASGHVSSSDEGGGLVGFMGDGGAVSIERSHATGEVECHHICGGLVGTAYSYESAKISQSYATGTVTGLSVRDGSDAGGLVGDDSECNSCGIANSYASGTVTGLTAGGLVGTNSDSHWPRHSIQNSYASGAVKGATWAGGLVGWENVVRKGKIKRAYWDMTTSGITDPSQGAGNVANDPGIKGLTDKKLKSGLPKGFNPKIWAEDANINNGLPYLINNPPPK